MISRYVLRTLLPLLAVASLSCKEKVAPPKVSPPTVAEAEALAKRLEASISPCKRTEIDSAMDYDKLLARTLRGHRLGDHERDQIRREMTNAIGGMLCTQLDSSDYTYLRTQMIDGVPRPLLRVVDASGAFNYHQLELDKQGGDVRAVDIYFFASGENMSETFRALTETLVGTGSTAASNSLRRIRQLMDTGDHAEARALLQKLPAAVRGTKAAMLLDVKITGESIESPEYLAAIDAYAKAFPNDPSLDLVVLDGLFLRKKYDEALAVLDKIDQRVGGDPYLDTMRAGIHGEAGRHPEALAAAKRATEREPTLEAGWWQLLTQQSAAKEHGAALATLEVLRDKFSAVVDHDSLAGDERYVGLAASDEFAAWSAKQRE